jgi:hypothetical protein
MRRLFANNGLSIVAASLFLLISLFGQTTAGNRVYNGERRDEGKPEVSFGEYRRTAHFGEATFENWESEFLRHDPEAPWPMRRGGRWLTAYKSSLSIAFLVLFIASVLLHAATGSRVFND